eukprot:s444_g54.t1
MSEARGRPRPSQRGRVDPDEGEDVGYAAELVDIGEQGEGGADVEDDLYAESCVKPEMHYQPRLHVKADDVLKVGHRLDFEVGGPGRTSASVKRAVSFVGQYEEKYNELAQQRVPVKKSVEGGEVRCKISVDQYNAVVLAITPLQRLWAKANEHGLAGCFGDPLKVEQVLALVEKDAGCVQQSKICYV